MKYNVYLATGSNRFREVADQPRTLAGVVEASCLEEAFEKCQNHEEPWNPDKPCRSVCVGDVLEEEHSILGLYDRYMVCAHGFGFLTRHHSPVASEVTIEEMEVCLFYN